MGVRFSLDPKQGASQQAISIQGSGASSHHEASQAAQAILTLEQVSHQHRSTVLLSNISLSVQTGEILALVGPNGAGKSTLLNIMSGMTSASAGQVYYEGRPLCDLSCKERAKTIAVIAQHSQVDERLSLQDYVALGRLPHLGGKGNAEHGQHLESALRDTGLLGLKGRPFGLLSGGEKQRAHIARAICQQPRLLFLDEPTNHLDPCARGELLSLVSRLGITVVTVLHDLSLVPVFANKVAVLDKAQLVAFGHADQALSRENVQRIFGVDFIRLRHPKENRSLHYMDIRVV